jgi:hypothetical protein
MRYWLLRCVVLKHIKGWSYRQLHRELRASLPYGAPRAFMRTQFQITAICVELSRSLARHSNRSTNGSCSRPKKRPLSPERSCAPIRPRWKLTSTIQQTAPCFRIRCGSCYLQRIVEGARTRRFELSIIARAAKHRVLEIGRAARIFTQAGQEQLKQSYKKLIGSPGPEIEPTVLQSRQVHPVRKKAPLPRAVARN